MIVEVSSYCTVLYCDRLCCLSHYYNKEGKEKIHTHTDINFPVKVCVMFRLHSFKVLSLCCCFVSWPTHWTLIIIIGLEFMSFCPSYRANEVTLRGSNTETQLSGIKSTTLASEINNKKGIKCLYVLWQKRLQS